MHLQPASSVAPAAMKHTLAGVTTGLAVVAAEVDGTSTTVPLLRSARCWAISIPAEQQTQVLQDLRGPAGTPCRTLRRHRHGRHDGAASSVAPSQMFAVTPRDTVRASDHALVLLEATCLQRDQDQRPLVSFNSATHALSTERSLA
jgi:hypothetical protein